MPCVRNAVGSMLYIDDIFYFHITYTFEGSKLPSRYLDPKHPALEDIPLEIYRTGVDRNMWKQCESVDRPDILKRESTESAICGHLYNPTIKYAFQSPIWFKCGFETVYLKKVFRQENIEWIEHLERIARGELTEETIKYLEYLRRPLNETKDGIKPTRLYAKRIDVMYENYKELNKLTKPEYNYGAVDTRTMENTENGKKIQNTEIIKPEEITRKDYKSWSAHLLCIPVADRLFQRDSNVL